MILNEMEKQHIQDLKAQEETCIEKYSRYKEQAKDPVLKELFQTLQENEQQHYQSLEQVLTGKVPSCDCNDSAGKEYMPKNTYEPMSSNEEKYVSSEYNNNVFAFANTQIRKLLADIQVEEQNHAEMLYKYKTVNGMA